VVSHPFGVEQVPVVSRSGSADPVEVAVAEEVAVEVDVLRIARHVVRLVPPRRSARVELDDAERLLGLAGLVDADVARRSSAVLELTAAKLFDGSRRPSACP
jgi:hypothetical protein